MGEPEAANLSENHLSALSRSKYMNETRKQAFNVSQKNLKKIYSRHQITAGSIKNFQQADANEDLLNQSENFQIIRFEQRSPLEAIP